MLTPQAGSTGNLAFKDVLQDFVEFSPIGDVKDLLSGIAGRDQGVELDWAERALSIASFLPVLGMRAATRSDVRFNVHDRINAETALLESQQQTQLATATWNRMREGKEITDQNRALLSTHFQELALKLQTPQLAALGDADHMGDLAHFVANTVDPDFGQRLLGDTDLDPTDVARFEEIGGFLRAWGTTLTETVPELAIDSPDFTADPIFEAAQNGIAYLHSFASQGVMYDNGRLQTASDTLQRLISDPESQVDLAQKVQLLISLGASIDGSLTPTSEVKAMWKDPNTGEQKVAVSWSGELLPSDRLYDGENVVATDEVLVNRWRRMDYRPTVPDMSWNVLDAYARQSLNLKPADLKRAEQWYRRFNKSVLKLAELSGHPPMMVAEVASAFSTQTAWLPNNLVAAIHYLLPNRLQPGTPEYSTAFREVVKAGAWQVELAKESKGQMAHASKSGEVAMDAWSNPDALPFEDWQKSMLGTYKGKKLTADEILLYQLPIQLMLGQYKTHNFAALALDPDTLAAVVIDTHSFSTVMGTTRGNPGGGATGLTNPDGSPQWKTPPEKAKILSDADGKYYMTGRGDEKTKVHLDEEGFVLDDGKRVQATKSYPGITMGFSSAIWTKVMKKGETYRFPDTNLTIDKALVEKAIARLEEVGLTKADATDRIQKALGQIHKPDSAVIFQSMVQAHQLAAQVIGNIMPHQAQSVSWTWMKNVKETEGESTLNQSMLNHGEGVSSKYPGALAHIGVVTDEGTPLPEFVSKTLSEKPKNVFGKTDSLVMLPTQEGGMSAWVLPEGQHADSVRDMTRTLSTTPIKQGKWSMLRPRKPRPVRDVGETRGKLAAAEGVGEIRMVQPGQATPELEAGQYYAFEVRAGEEAEWGPFLEGIDSGFYPTFTNISFQRTGTSSSLSEGDFAAMEPVFENPGSSPFVTHDWGALSAELHNLTPEENAARHARLGEELRAKGYTAIESKGWWPDDKGVMTSEKSYMVFGISNQQLMDIGSQYEQVSVVSRHGMFFLKDFKTDDGVLNAGTHLPSNNELLFGQAAVKNKFYTSIEWNGKTYSVANQWDWDSNTPSSEPNSMMGQALPAEKRVRVTVPLGGTRTPYAWPKVQKLVDSVTKKGGWLDMEMHTHGAMWVDPSWKRQADHRFTTDASQLMFRSSGDVDSRAGHQYDVYTPAWKTGLTDAAATETYRRTPTQLRELTTNLDEKTVDVGGVTFDFSAVENLGDVPDSGRQLSRTVDGSKSKTVVVELTERGPIVHVGVDMPATPGLIRVEVNSRNGIRRVDASSQRDLLDAHEAIASTGAWFDGEDIAYVAGERLPFSWSE